MPIIKKEKEDFIDHLDDCQCQRCVGANPNLYANGGTTINGRMIMKRFDGTGGKTYNLIKDDRGEKPYYTLEEEESGKIISEGESYYEVNEISNMFGGNYAKGGKLYTKDELLKKFKGKFIDTYPNYDYTTKETKYEVRSVKSKIHENHETPEEIVYGYAKGGEIKKGNKYQLFNYDINGMTNYEIVDLGKVKNIEQVYLKPLDAENRKEIVIPKKMFLDILSKNKYAKGGTTDDVIMIEIGGDKKYPYYIKKIDTTHLAMANNKDGVDLVVPSHILQHKGESYYDDVRSWLRGGTSPDGKSYDSDYYAKGGEVKKKGNEMIVGGLAGIVFGFLLNK